MLVCMSDKDGTVSKEKKSQAMEDGFAVLDNDLKELEKNENILKRVDVLL